VWCGLVVTYASGQEPVARDPLNVATAAHFLNQATFGPSPSDVAAVQAKGLEHWLQEQFLMPESAIPDGLNTSQVRAQVFTNMATAPDQLRQRMIFALSQIFVVSANKVGSGPELTPWMRLLSRNAFGNYRTLLREVTLNPTMGKYLDLAYSRRATRTTSINENYAREMLQLFSIGLWELNQDGTVKGGGTPTYGQDTIREFARALTGWTFPTQPGATPGSTNPQYFEGEMEPRPANHDNGSKRLFFGVTLPAGQPPQTDLENVIDVVFAHPNVPPFVATRLIRSLVKSNPSPAYIRRVADVFANNGQGVRGDLRAVLAAVLLDPEARTFTPDDGRLKDPVLHVIGLGRALNAEFRDVNAFMGVFSNLSELVLTPTTVFSFYSPLAPLPGRRDLFGPEFQIYPPALAIQRANFIYSLITNGYSSAFRIDLAPFTAVAANDTALVDRVNQALMFGTMSPQLRQIIIEATRAIPSNTTQRAQGALYLAAISSEFSVFAAASVSGLPPAGGGPGAPASVEGLTGTANGSTLALSWRNGSSGPAPEWIVLDVTGSLAVSLALPPGQSFTYTGVPDGTYTFTVRAANALGTSAPSNPVTLTFPSGGCAGPPQAPTAFAMTRNGNVVTVSWQPPAGGPAPSSYVLNVGGALSASIPTGDRALQGAVSPGTYTASVSAVNACGTGPASPARTITVP
jgi:uncharacterized protein (DUF1800 family)